MDGQYGPALPVYTVAVCRGVPDWARIKRVRLPYSLWRGTAPETDFAMTLPEETLHTAFRTAVRLRGARPAGLAKLEGIQMEGPFFSEKRKGAQNGAYLRNPDYDFFKRLYDASEGLVRIVDLAPELPGSVDFVRRASALCTVSVAHTEADYDAARAAFDAGATHEGGKVNVRRIRENQIPDRQAVPLLPRLQPRHHSPPGCRVHRRAAAGGHY